jgi:hypothetical protein
MYYRCKRFKINQERNQVRDSIKNRSKTISVLKDGASDCLVCHRTVSGAPGPYNSKPATLGNLKTRSAIFHRTVRCASKAMTLCANGRLCKKLQYRGRSQSNKVTGHRTVRCSKTTKAPTVDQLWTLTVALMWRAPDSAQWLSGGAPDCPVRPSPAAFTNGYGSGWGL